jgi:hypothetical protein
MISFTRANGSLTVQLGSKSQDLLPLVQEVINSGPSMAWITSNAVIVLAPFERA